MAGPKTLTKRNIKPTVKPKARPEAEEEVDEDVETTTEKVVITKALATLITNWEKAAKSAEAYWPRVVAFVIENETTRDELRQALIDIRGMQKITANNELSVIFRVAEFPDEVQACIDGDDNPDTGEVWQVRELRELGKKKQEGGGRDPEDLFKRKIKTVARFAIEEAQIELPEFLSECKAAYKTEHARAEAALAKAEEKGGNSEDEEEGEEED